MLLLVVTVLTGAPLGAVVSLVIVRELEGALALLALMAVQLLVDPKSSYAGLMPLWSTRELTGYARARALRRHRGAVLPGGMGVQRPQAAHQEIRADPGIPGDAVAVNRPGCDDHVRAQSCAAARVVVEIGPGLRVRRVSSAWPVPRRRTRVGATREGVSCPGWTPPAFLQLCRSPFRPHPLTPEPGYPRPRVPDSFVYPRQQCIAQYEQAELGHPGHGIQANREEEGWGKRW